jgi:tetratricopeptide (TPR) repeat protein
MREEGRYLAAVFTDLEQHSAVWGQASREHVVAAIAEYRYLAESLASEFGAVHRHFTGDGHLVLFDSADAAVRFGLNVIRAWTSTSARHASVPHMALRVGCHFGECMAIENGRDWVGRAIVLAKRVEGVAASDRLFITESVLELLDLPVYRYEEAGTHSLKGDHLASRSLYCVRDLDSAAAVAPEKQELSGDGWFLRGAELVRGGRGNTAEEEECYRRAIALRPDYPEAHNNLGAVLRARGDLSGAAEEYRAALRLRPGYPEAHYNYGILLQTLGSVQGAVEHLRRALELRPDYVDAHYGLANLLRVLGDLGEAASHYKTAIELRPNHGEARSNYAMLLEDQGNLAAAEAQYRASVEVQSPQPQAHYNYALFLEARGELLGAEREYRLAIESRPDLAEAHNNLAGLLYVRGDDDLAEAHYREALQLKPNDPETHYNLSLVLRRRHAIDEADDHLRIARELATELPP